MDSIDLIHPGLTVRRECLDRSGLTVTAGAFILGVSRQALSNLVTGKAGISPEMAIRLDLVFGGGAEAWLQKQLAYDLAEARQHSAMIRVRPITDRPDSNAQQRLL
jgi:antitoxin HigA-1